MKQLAENLWILRYPLSLIGLPIGRTVTVLRLSSGGVIVHSTAPFSPGEVASIRDLGAPLWLVDATLFHDTYSREGSRAFPDAPYLVPEGFPARERTQMQPLLPAPAEWAGEIDVLLLAGMPAVREHVMLHRPSRTLIAADLVFNWADTDRGWQSWILRQLTGVKHPPQMSRIYRKMIRDRAEFAASVRQLMQWDFDRVIPAHGEVITSGGKEQLRQALGCAGFEC